MHATEAFCRGNMSMKDLVNVLIGMQENFPPTAFHLFFTANHDENSWNGTEYEKYGAAAKAMAVFTCTWPGTPLLYSGQELPNHKRLKFFEKDFIEWQPKILLHDFYKKLFHLYFSFNTFLFFSQFSHLKEIKELHGIYEEDSNILFGLV